MVAIGFNWKRATWQGAAAAAAVGILVNVGLDLARKYPSQEEPFYALPGGVSLGGRGSGLLDLRLSWRSPS